MLSPAKDLLRHAAKLIASPTTSFAEVDRRRAVSAAYYSLFHALTMSGGVLFGNGADDALKGQISRSFNHGPMRQVCLLFKAASVKGFQLPYIALMPATVGARLFSVVHSFLRLQEARLTADYDMLAVVNPYDALSDVRLATRALDDWQAISTTPEARIFLTALLLADRWTRRG